ncbi:MAG TPA: hypothetical protein VG097_19560 [Gemmata sp.]|jgi:hypothetical protein|nr:hypothetical protein [Gemmata sp.]
MSRKVSVHHFVANMTTSQSGAHPTSNLLGVDYWYDVPPDAEFPRTIAWMDLFTRFYLLKAKPVEFYIRVLWQDAPERSRRKIARFGPYMVGFKPDKTVHDHVFKIFNIRLQGVGRHTIQLLRRRYGSWERPRLTKLIETHFFVEQ